MKTLIVRYMPNEKERKKRQRNAINTSCQTAERSRMLVTATYIARLLQCRCQNCVLSKKIGHKVGWESHETCVFVMFSRRISLSNCKRRTETLILCTFYLLLIDRFVRSSLLRLHTGDKPYKTEFFHVVNGPVLKKGLERQKA